MTTDAPGAVTLRGRLRSRDRLRTLRSGKPALIAWLEDESGKRRAIFATGPAAIVIARRKLDEALAVTGTYAQGLPARLVAAKLGGVLMVETLAEEAG